MLYMVTFTINIPPMLAYIPYMDPMGYISYIMSIYVALFRPDPGRPNQWVSRASRKSSAAWPIAWPAAPAPCWTGSWAGGVSRRGRSNASNAPGGSCLKLFDLWKNVGKSWENGGSTFIRLYIYIFHWNRTHQGILSVLLFGGIPPCKPDHLNLSYFESHGRSPTTLPWLLPGFTPVGPIFQADHLLHQQR